MASDGKVIIDTQLNNKGFTKGLSAMKTQTEGLSSAVKKLGGVIASAFAVKAIVSFSKECLELGSNVSEVQNVVDTAFGDMAYKVETFADTAIQNFGMSRLAAKKTASTYMAMAKGMGLTEEAASDMSISLAGMTGDVASFYNITQEAADAKLKSVFTGESESLKELGVVMTQTNLQAYALEKGITKDISAMSQAEQVSLRYGYVMKSLALAQGDFAKTSDSWANQTRILSMQWQEFMSIVGQSLITVLTPVVKALNQIVSALISAANTISKVISNLFGGADQQLQQTQKDAGAIGGAINESVENQDALTDATKETAKAQEKLLAGFDEINKLSAGASGGKAVGASGGTAGIGVPGLETVTVDANTSPAAEKITKFFDDLKAAAEPLKIALGNLWGELDRLSGFAGDGLKDFYETFLKPVGQWVLGEGLPRLVDAIANGLASIDWGKLNGSLKNLWDSVLPFAQNVGEGLLWFYESILVPLGAWLVDEVVTRFLDDIATLIDGVNAVIEIAKPHLKYFWEDFLKPLGEWTGDQVLLALDLLNGALEVLVGLLEGDTVRAMNGVKAIGDSLKKCFDNIRTALEKLGANGIMKALLAFQVGGIPGGISAVLGMLNGAASSGGGSGGTRSIPQIPKLASGAVIPPNREFLAVLGDQKSGTNIETPLDTMVAAFKQAMFETGGGNNGGNTTIILELDGVQFGKATFKAYNKESRRVGVNLAGV